MIPTADQHPLPRDGTSQAARVPTALDPNRSLLDDRALDDLLFAVRGTSSGLTYFNLANHPAGTWERFLDGRMPVELAVLARWSTATFRNRLASLTAGLASGPEESRLLAGQQSTVLLASELGRIDGWARVFADSGFLTTVERVIAQTLATPLDELAGAIRAVAGPQADTWLEELSAQLTSSQWDFDPNAVVADAALAAATRDEQFAGLALRLQTLGDAIIEAIAHLATEAEAFLNSGSMATGDQPAHLALLLTWLTQFRHAQAALNDLIRRTLEFYYRALLQIRPKAAVPDHVFVTFEPARNTEAVALVADTRLYAGKDDNGTERHFGLTRELVVNRATIAELRSLYVDAAGGQWRAATVANSADGIGAALPKDQPAWQPFGNATLPTGRRGFAIAAPVLRLTGGDKKVTLALQLASSAGTLLETRCEGAQARGGPDLDFEGQWPLSGVFSLAVTGAEGWLVIDPARWVAKFDPATHQLSLVIGPLRPDEPIANYDVALHGRAFATLQPILEVTLLPLPATGTYPADFLDRLELEGVAVSCDVDQDANLVLATDLGTIDPTKPFQPFGPAPTAAPTSTSFGSSLYVGSAELFSKHVTSLDLDITWKDQPAGSLTPYKVRPWFLSATRWLALGTTEAALFTNPIQFSDSALAAYPADAGLDVFSALTPGLPRGFLRLSLSAPASAFGHGDYTIRYTTAILASVSNGTRALDMPAFTEVPIPNNNIPAPPVAPVAAAVTATYSVDESRDFGSGAKTTFEWHQVEPHGEWPVAANGPFEVLPAPPADGVFYIALENALSGSQVSILFHLAEGSGDPFSDYPQISWEYLAGDTWRPFETQDVVVDGTNELRRTGVMVFSLPADATTEHFRMPSGRHWLRALAVGDDTALNRAYTLTPQAAEAVFVDQGNDLERLSVPLPAGSVTRLVTANPAIKKLDQPLPSFGGAAAETGSPYYLRVSERLRHRQRAFTLWDYERLVLEAFPSLHKVKCIPHTRSDSELAPGHVMVVLIPQLAEDAFDPQRPAASQELLDQVADFLAPAASAHVRLEVVNPLYEEVQVIARLAIRSGFDQGFYLAQAATDLTVFLAPWLQGETGGLAFGREIYPSTILNFLEERDYIDFVSEFRVRQFVAGVALVPDPALLAPTTERSILVSHRVHDLQLA